MRCRKGENVPHGAIWILLQALLAIDVADRAHDQQFAAPRFLPPGLDRPLTQQIELVLVETVFETEQQPVVAQAWSVDG